MNSDTRYRTLQLLKLRNGDDDEQSTPAPPEDQIEGSKTNPKGSAEGDSDEEIEFSEQKSSIPWSMAILVFTSFLFAVSNFGAETGVNGIDI